MQASRVVLMGLAVVCAWNCGLALEVTGARVAATAGARVASGDAVADFLLCPAAVGTPLGLGATVWWGAASLDQLRDALDRVHSVRSSDDYSPAELRDLLTELAADESSARGEQSFGAAARLPSPIGGLGVSVWNEASWGVAAVDLDTVNIDPEDIDQNTSLLELRGSYLGQVAVAIARGLGAGPLGEISVGCQLRYVVGKGLTDTVSLWDARQEGLEWGDLARKGGSSSAVVLDLGARLRLSHAALGAAVRNVNQPWLRWGDEGPPETQLERSLIVALSVDVPGGLSIEADAEVEAEQVAFGTERWMAVGAELPVAGAVIARAGGRRQRDGGEWLMGLGGGVSLGPVSLDAAVTGRPWDGWRDLGGAVQAELAL